MKNKLLLILLVAFSAAASSQEKDFYELLGWSKVTMNKNLTAYTLNVQKKENGIIVTDRTIEPNINNPHYIKIKSSRKAGKITLKNKGFKSDIITEFEYIYQGDYENGKTPYYFVSKEKQLIALFSDNDNYNNSLMISFYTDTDNVITFHYTISEY